MQKKTTISSILRRNYILLTIIGSHAGESITDIFERKKDEVRVGGNSFWLIKSNKARTEHIQKLCACALNEGEDVFCLFIEPSIKGGAKPTTMNTQAYKFSYNEKDWENIPDGIKVTGKISKNTTALVLENLEITLDEGTEIDLWKYSDYLDQSSPIKFSLGSSTICATKIYNVGMKSRYRKIVAFGKLKKPFAVWLK